jgi:hypothetical protein
MQILSESYTPDWSVCQISPLINLVVISYIDLYHVTEGWKLFVYSASVMWHMKTFQKHTKDPAGHLESYANCVFNNVDYIETDWSEYGSLACSIILKYVSEIWTTSNPSDTLTTYSMHGSTQVQEDN